MSAFSGRLRAGLLPVLFSLTGASGFDATWGSLVVLLCVIWHEPVARVPKALQAEVFLRFRPALHASCSFTQSAGGSLFGPSHVRLRLPHLFGPVASRLGTSVARGFSWRFFSCRVPPVLWVSSSFLYPSVISSASGPFLSGPHPLYRRLSDPRALPSSL